MTKIYTTTLFSAILISCGLAATAQTGINPYNNIGRDRSIGMTQYSNGPRKNAKPDYVASSLEKLTTELTLDGFQQAVIKEQLENTKIEEDKVAADNIPDVSKSEKIRALRQKLDEEIIKILTPEQKDKFTEFKDKLAKKKK